MFTLNRGKRNLIRAFKDLKIEFGNYLLADFFIGECLKNARRQPPTALVRILDEHDALQLALFTLQGLINKYVTSGQMHTYRGVLGLEGQHAVELYMAVGHFIVQMGFTSKEEFDNERMHMLEEIKHVG